MVVDCILKRINCVAKSHNFFNDFLNKHSQNSYRGEMPLSLVNLIERELKSQFLSDSFLQFSLFLAKRRVVESSAEHCQTAQLLTRSLRSLLNCIFVNLAHHNRSASE